MRFPVAMVEALLTRRFEAPVQVIASQRLSPWFVVRCRLAGPAARIPGSVIVKVLRQDPAGFRTDPRQVATERAALEFVGGLDATLVPRLWSSDLSAGILILQDLAPRVPLAALLREGDAAASTDGLRQFARTLGRLAAVTAGHEDVYGARRRGLTSVEPEPQRRGVSSAVWSRTRSFMAAIDASAPAAAEHDMARAMQELTHPGPFLALSNGDAGPNNYLVSGADGRLIDFEAAGYRHAAEDAVCFRVPGPHWLTAGDATADGTEAAFRTVLADAIPEATDDRRFGAAMAAACLAFAVLRLHRFAKVDARGDGDPARPQLVSTLEAAGRAAERHRALPHLRDWVFQVASALRRRWPHTDVDLGALAPYTPRSAEQPMRPVVTSHFEVR